MRRWWAGLVATHMLGSLRKRTPLVNQGSALLRWCRPRPPISSISRTRWSTKALLRPYVVGAGGVEPPSSSVSDPTEQFPARIPRR
jgi:hypothetical protein